MEKNLLVPYQSQHGDDSKLSNNDCGAASLAMVLTFLGHPITTGQVLEKLGNPTGFTTLSQLIKLAQDLGLKAESKVDTTFNELKSYIDKGLPVIVVGGYGYLNSTQEKADLGEKGFTGSHIMPIVGYREDDSVYANDPDFWGERLKEGDHHVYTGPEFFTFWRNEGNKEGNKPNTILIVSKPEQTVEKVKVISDKGLNGRSATSVTASLIQVFTKGTVLDVLSTTTGEAVLGNNKWYEIKEPKVFVWSGGVETVKVEKPKEVKPEVKPAVDNRDEIIKGLREENDKLVEAVKKINKLTTVWLSKTEIAEPNVTTVDAGRFASVLELLHLK